MDHLRASILRPQLGELMERVAKWSELYQMLEEGLRSTPGLTIVERPKSEKYVGSSFQFLLLDWHSEKVKKVVADCFSRGVELKWFGEANPHGFTSRYDSWRYVQSEPMVKTDRVLSGLLDLRLPLSFTKSDCALIASIIKNVVQIIFESLHASDK